MHGLDHHTDSVELSRAIFEKTELEKWSKREVNNKAQHSQWTVYILKPTELKETTAEEEKKEEKQRKKRCMCNSDIYQLERGC